MTQASDTAKGNIVSVSLSLTNDISPLNLYTEATLAKCRQGKKKSKRWWGHSSWKRSSNFRGKSWGELTVLKNVERRIFQRCINIRAKLCIKIHCGFIFFEKLQSLPIFGHKKTNIFLPLYLPRVRDGDGTRIRIKQ